ncbi:hypothetical protein [Bergeyella zoohelcum]|uniref:Uncharacterized protein n=1 Tax=Bergeyella zoohelcum TaxID=1015 RepID=A0A380ZVV4_9FLAO|nr:hypothetical protein [Bergeyella zoohelcum]EKB58394.1 hypothetical protein HMPREF9700_01846 [Bergeyella zoohelcum CCUG 30536]SUV53145.1 Uncharacterised protein [Bergeyella zoohelcum]
MKQILQNIQNRLAEITELRYIDEDWGQIDYYSPNMPVQWPCCLIDIQSGQFANISKDITKRPKDRQNGSFAVKITLANMKLTNTSYLAPQGQKDNAWAIFELVEKIHQKLHGFSPRENCSKMLRTSFGRTQRDDGVQEYAIMYEFEAHNV